ncbi:DNA-binding response regulator, OmpR family, contains REC and winged-helix (wHTH) domain [Anaerosphaera aminiphila DSM 21120]|uniref:DNA-binding response regulator, OmpR family, contains REC and winged-helix (WHTH) domain n=1 Tax=Anaerosphaera aminiphila DSM 21120 TaxID=1120995 RepID=A0A1M5NSG3_9FIRM|nr:response regulator transcription factor [Anaerosphaera aminiphila]SHG92139.1 DNA-binding response regulator, OmpR family, contains REC and winged-helix (wHTH) domain [Anaerosphaera aminiphila DSM 21120]
MQKYKILVAEDDKAIRDSIGIYLTNSNYDVVYAENGKEAIEKFQSEKIDLVIMDLMMPEMSGEEAIIKLREKSFVPIIILSAKSEDYDKVIGLNIGADDYIVKPFNPLELMARVNSNIRRLYQYQSSGENSESIEIGGIKLNTMEKNVYVDGEKVSLTSLEYKILELLMENPNRVFSIDEIYERVWNEPAIEPKTVTVHIRRIREKIEFDPKKPLYLKVAWGLGYKFVNPKRRN